MGDVILSFCVFHVCKLYKCVRIMVRLRNIDYSVHLRLRPMISFSLVHALKENNNRCWLVSSLLSDRTTVKDFTFGCVCVSFRGFDTCQSSKSC